MNREQIKAQVATENAISNLNFNFTRQFDDRVLTATDINIEVQDPKDSSKLITVSFDPANPGLKFKVKTPWVSHWENDKRIRVVMHQDVMSMMRADPNLATLALKKELETAKSSGLPMIKYTVITPRNIELSF